MPVKKLVIVAGLILAAIAAYAGWGQGSGSGPYEGWRHNWNWSVPEAERVDTVFYNYGRDPDAYHILDYSAEKLEELRRLPSWSRVEGHPSYIAERVASFQEQVGQFHPEQRDKYEALFSKHAFQITPESLYYTQRKGDGSYFIAVLNPDRRQLHVFEMFF